MDDCDRDRAICSNTPGSFNCTCKPGYIGTGKKGECLGKMLHCIITTQYKDKFILCPPTRSNNFSTTEPNHWSGWWKRWFFWLQCVCPVCCENVWKEYIWETQHHCTRWQKRLSYHAKENVPLSITKTITRLDLEAFTTSHQIIFRFPELLCCRAIFVPQIKWFIIKRSNVTLEFDAVQVELHCNTISISIIVNTANVHVQLNVYYCTSRVSHFILISDIEECNLGCINCPANSQCSNKEGSYECKCKAGYKMHAGFCIGKS